MQRQNTTREALAGLLHGSPGLTPADAARALGVDRTTIQYHLRRLVREGRAVTGGAPRSLRYFPPGAVPRDARAAFIAAQGEAPLLDALRHAPGCTPSALARDLGVPRQRLAWHLGRLRKAGLVRAERQGREVHLSLETGTFLPPPGTR
jgi:predicted transcriptional regulator